jgi:hypothetical protein
VTAVVKLKQWQQQLVGQDAAAGGDGQGPGRRSSSGGGGQAQEWGADIAFDNSEGKERSWLASILAPVTAVTQPGDAGAGKVTPGGLSSLLAADTHAAAGGGGGGGKGDWEGAGVQELDEHIDIDSDDERKGKGKKVREGGGGGGAGGEAECRCLGVVAAKEVLE